MYIRENEGLGQVNITRNGHERVKWSLCSKIGSRQRVCGITLKIRFRISFEDFRKEVERGLRSWMTGPRAQMLSKKRAEQLKSRHKIMVDLKMPDNSPIELPGLITYRGPDGPQQEWRVVDWCDDMSCF